MKPGQESESDAGLTRTVPHSDAGETLSGSPVFTAAGRSPRGSGWTSRPSCRPSRAAVSRLTRFAVLLWLTQLRVLRYRSQRALAPDPNVVLGSGISRPSGIPTGWEVASRFTGTHPAAALGRAAASWIRSRGTARSLDRTLHTRR